MKPSGRSWVCIVCKWQHIYASLPLDEARCMCGIGKGKWELTRKARP